RADHRGAPRRPLGEARSVGAALRSERPAYLAPAQLTGRAADSRRDQSLSAGFDPSDRRPDRARSARSDGRRTNRDPRARDEWIVDASHEWLNHVTPRTSESKSESFTRAERSGRTCRARATGADPSAERSRRKRQRAVAAASARAQ